MDAGGGFVAVGPTEAKKGRTVATIFEDVTINPAPSKVSKNMHARTQMRHLWCLGRGLFAHILTCCPQAVVCYVIRQHYGSNL